MKKSVWANITIILTISMIFGCTAQTTQASGKLEVVATIYPIYDFAKNIGGDRIQLFMLIPPGVEPHEFELSPSAAKKISSARVFLYNGAGMEPWVPNLIQGMENTNIIAIDTSKGIDLVSSEDPDEPGKDPHFWLDPILAKKQVITIRNALIEADPAGKEEYTKNAASYLNKLDELDAQFRKTMAPCNKRDILISHATLAYFCKEYNCKQIPIEGIAPEAEPLPGEIVEIVKQAKQNNVKTVFVEKLVSPKAAQTIADEIGGTVATFNTVHGITAEEQNRGETYLSLMQENLQTIKTALGCN